MTRTESLELNQEKCRKFHKLRKYEINVPPVAPKIKLEKSLRTKLELKMISFVHENCT